MNHTYNYIKIKEQNQFVNIILNRKEQKNALNPQMIDEIQHVFDTNYNNSNNRVILISSSSNIFCAGADIKYLKKIKDFSYTKNLKDSKLLMNLFKTMLTYPKLIISKVSGAAIGGGCGLVTASDIVFATEESIFGYPEVKIGFIPALVSTFLMKKINETDARELLLTGNLIKSKKAKEIGLINYISKTRSINNDINLFIEKSFPYLISLKLVPSINFVIFILFM